MVSDVYFKINSPDTLYSPVDSISQFLVRLFLRNDSDLAKKNLCKVYNSVGIDRAAGTHDTRLT